MQIQAIRFFPKNEKTEPAAVQHDVSTAEDLQPLRRPNAPVAYLVGLETLEHLATLGPACMDCGEKDPDIELSRAMLKHPDSVYPLLRADFAPPKKNGFGQIRRSIEALLRSAVEESHHTAHFIGVPNALFDVLVVRAKPHGENNGPSNSSNDPYQELIRTMRQLPVPKSLESAFVGISPEAQAVRQLIVHAANHDHIVLVIGETGTGKEIVANQIHLLAAERGRKGALRPINCGALSSDLARSELFGHQRGTFTGADRDRQGLFEVANGGTIFLDEIGDLQLQDQVKVLRTLAEGQIDPLGAKAPKPVDVRIIAATNRDLFAMVRQGLFREDLYYRLRESIPIITPPLREHPEDIPILAEHFWRHIVPKSDHMPLPRNVCDLLCQYRWAGNCRELRAVLNNLYDSYGPRPTVEQLDVIMRFHGQPPIPDAATDPTMSNAFHRIDCLRHLRRVDEIVAATQVKLDPANQSGRSRAHLQSAARECLLELEQVCARPALFHTTISFDCTRLLKDCVASYLDQCDDGQPAEYYRTELLPHADLTANTLLEAIKSLTQ